MIEFQEFEKIGRLSRDMVITEKLDGTNASIIISADGEFATGSRTRIITPQDDNFGFSKWAHGNKDELMKLGEGRHFGEWWGEGIQRRYGIKGKQFSLFNVARWEKPENVLPNCCSVVPVLYRGPFDTAVIQAQLTLLGATGSKASPGFMRPEGIVIFHTQARVLFKKTFEKDDQGKNYGA